MSNFTKIDPASYFREREQNAVLHRKDATVMARPAVVGETITTVTSGDHEETTKTASVNEMVIRNPGGEEYIIGGEKFSSRYELEEDGTVNPDGYKLYRAKGGPLPCLKLDESVTFTAPWGSDMHIQEGGVLVNGGGADIYGIQPEEFAATYRPCNPDGTFI